MSRRRPGRLLAVAAIWLLLIGVAVVGYKLFYVPQQEEDTRKQTSSERREGLQTVPISLDAFSGYCVFRSSQFREVLESEGLFPELVDDGADYRRRANRLGSGEAPFATFTIDAWIKVCAEQGKVPGTIVMVVDESQGADALVAVKSAIPSIDALNDSSARILVTADSPSDTLVRVVRNDFQLPLLEDDQIENVSGPAEILRRLRTDPPGSLKAYSLWEPFVSRAESVPNVIRLADSSKVSGTIVDVLVVQRKYLLDRPEVVESVVRAYLQALYDIRRGEGLVQCVQQDAERLGEPVTAEEARKIVGGIGWKGAADNFNHMGLLDEQGSRRDDLALVIARIGKLLLRSGAIQHDPTEGRPHEFFYDRTLRSLRESNFHPADRISDRVVLRPLSPREQSQLVEVGKFQADPISFAAGSARISEFGNSSLEALVEKLDKWHRSYLVIVGHVSNRGDAEANRRLAQQRGERVREFLTAAGVDGNRLLVRTAPSSGGSYTVSFVAAELPY